MTDHDPNVKPDASGALAERLQARRAREAGGLVLRDDRGSLADVTAPKAERDAHRMAKSTAPDPDSSNKLADRLMARRAKQAQGASDGGEGEGNLGKEIAREPLFVGLGIRGHHRAGRKDSEAPPVKPADASARGFEDLGAPDPQPTRSRRHRM